MKRKRHESKQGAKKMPVERPPRSTKQTLMQAQTMLHRLAKTLDSIKDTDRPSYA
jgi:hypothetical protein